MQPRAPFGGLILLVCSLGSCIPADRKNLPRCTKTDDHYTTPLDDARTWFLRGGDEVYEVVGPDAKIALEPSAGPPTLSRDATKMAYELKDRIVVRSLPPGALIVELARTP
jgi:hypothetical protein